MFSSISEGATRIKNLLMAEDIKRTIDAFRAMSVNIRFKVQPHTTRVRCMGSRFKGRDVVVQGVGMRGLKKPDKPLYLGNSGTTMRILPGILAGQDFEVVLTGDESLSSRPMMRIAEPLAKMGVDIEGRGRSRSELYPPLTIHGNRYPNAINYKSKIASAQVKSCILLAGLYVNGVTSVAEPVQSRDHTERMLGIFGCKFFDETLKGKFHRAGIQPLDCRVSVRGPVKLKSPGAIKIPGDISSAAFFIVAGCILPDVKIVIKDVGLNPTRTGILDILKRMNAEISIANSKVIDKSGEPSGDIIIKPSRLKGTVVLPAEVVRAIDEIPVVMAAACFAKGRTIIKGAEELRVKETDRIYSMATNLRKIGADIQVKKKNIIINGGKPLHGARVSSFGDHRTAMSMLVAGLGTKGRVIVTGLDCINKSFPNFLNLLNKLN